MRIPEKFRKNKNLFAFLVFGVVLAVYGWKWADDNGYLASFDPPMPLVSENKDAKGESQKKERESPSIPQGPETRSNPEDAFGLGGDSKPSRSPNVESALHVKGEEGKPEPSSPPASTGTGQTASPARAAAPAVNVSAATQSELMRIQADIMLLKARVEKAKLQAELEKLEAPAASAIPELTPEMLASLTPPSGVKSLAPAVVPEPKARLVGVQGTAHRMTATVAMPSGQEVTVTVGDTLQGSAVRTIDKDGLRLANGKRIRWE